MQRPDFIQGAKLHVRTHWCFIIGCYFRPYCLKNQFGFRKIGWNFLSRFNQSGKGTHQFFISLSCLIFLAQNRGQFAAVRLIIAYRAEHTKMLSKSLNAKITFSLATSKAVFTLAIFSVKSHTRAPAISRLIFLPWPIYTILAVSCCPR
jgi:hypothetical protein